MQTIQLVLSDDSCATTLKQLLADNGNWAVSIEKTPGFGKGGVVVMDDKVMTCLAGPPEFPDRVVLITRDEPAILAHAWELGIRSVVYETDPPGTLLLAIMSVWLRLPRAQLLTQRGGISRKAPSFILPPDPQMSPNRRS